MTREFLPAGTAGIIEACPSALPASLEADAVVLFLTEGGVGQGVAATIDAALGGVLGRLANDGELTGRRYECVPLLAAQGLRASQLLVVGLGRAEELDLGVLYRAAATASRHLAGRPRSRVAFLAEPAWTTLQIEQAVAGAAVGMVGQDLYRSEPKRTRFGTTQCIGADPAAVSRGSLIADGVNLARRRDHLGDRAGTEVEPRPRREPHRLRRQVLGGVALGRASRGGDGRHHHERADHERYPRCEAGIRGVEATGGRGICCHVPRRLGGV